MALVINNNAMAANAARTLNTHYGNLATSTQRLSSGLRINSAADDAAGLAIRELMRADIAALNQGVRNANDAISMIQVVDGALSVIDEKLIRMKELAEQAATGTYDSTQRLMIDSEFQAMASEIERIARATDFNGLKMLDGTEKKSLANYQNSTESRSYTTTSHIETPDLSAPLWGKKTYEDIINTVTEETTIEYFEKDGEIYKKTTKNILTESEVDAFEKRADDIYFWWSLSNDKLDTRAHGGKVINPNFFDMDIFSLETSINIGDVYGTFNRNYDITYSNYEYLTEEKYGVHHYYYVEIDLDGDGQADVSSHCYANNLLDLSHFEIAEHLRMSYIQTPSTHESSISVEKSENIEKVDYPNGNVKIHFGPMNDSAEDYYYIEKRDCTISGLGLEDVRVETQDNAQKALVAINEAIVKKDQARAYYGAMQNRLENTVSNLTIQAENLQASESRISDMDVATEMTNYVRNQILTQSAIAMLSQANSMPQMAMQLIGG